ncbi:22575_t:CDS:2 [Dentiscutata erythropus]|uniref:22575_t:CDS:1 n=1 Tax=Dentiscutata erythropus TaxID=1348616 RepID=A0A9N9BP44_9GLOM|nr:22575_t:CDS:2 [Dentiscutata erythropus]
MEWIMGKCKQFLRFIQNNSTANRIKKEPSDENHFFYRNILVDKNQKVGGGQEGKQPLLKDSDQHSIAPTLGEETFIEILFNEKNQDDYQEINNNELSLEKKKIKIYPI